MRASLEAIASRPDGFGTSAPRWGLLITTTAAEEQVEAEESLERGKCYMHMSMCSAMELALPPF